VTVADIFTALRRRDPAGAIHVTIADIFTARNHGRRAQWWISFVLFALLLTAWALANPYGGGPDEPAHAIRAISVARGELVGPTRPGYPDNVRFVETPERFMHGSIAAGCFGFKPENSAACAPDLDTWPDGLVRHPVTNGRWPPTPYGAVGLPLVTGITSGAALYLMRFAGAAICAALFASALLSLRVARHQWLAASGLAFALTPMVFFVAGVVNPSNLEIAGGVGFWASAVVLAAQAGHGVVDSRVVARTGIGAGVLVLARPLGMIWLACAGLIVLLACNGRAIGLLLRSRAVQVWGAVVAACLLFEGVWILVYDTLGSRTPPGPSAQGLSNIQVLLRTIGFVPTSYREMVGVFGWIDTPAPSATLILWTSAIGVLVFLSLGLPRRRFAALVAATLALVILVPALLEAIEAKRFGFGWQGRYTLPLAVGLPIVAGSVLALERNPILPRRRLAWVFAGAFVVGHFLAFAQNLRRYAVGMHGSLLFWRDAEWSPPVPSSLLLVSYAAVLVILAFWLWNEARDAETATNAETRDAETRDTETRDAETATSGHTIQ
jgi:predicted membrane protein DUF2142